MNAIFNKLRTKISSVIILILFLFFITNFFGYKYLIKNVELNNVKNEQMQFYKIQRETNRLLTSVLFKYYKEKENLIKKHKEVVEYLKNKDYGTPLIEIQNIINKDLPNKPYNIYITDENLKIMNTTFKADLGFNLSFAKHLFDKHRKENIIGSSAPVFETFSSNFLSFTDSYLPNTNRILQVSYRYEDTNNDLKKIQKLIDSSQIIKDSHAYIIFKDGYIGDFIFKEYKAKKISFEEIKLRLKKGKDLEDKIKDHQIITELWQENDKNYKNLYFSQVSSIFDDAKIIYSVTFDQSNLENELNDINIISIILAISFIIIILFLFKVKDNEVLLNQKDTFIKHSVHEIKTPLTIISLNNQLRKKKMGEDRYTQKIDSAIKTLKNSYEDMAFLISKNFIVYEKSIIQLNEFVEERVYYFSTVAIDQGRLLHISTNSKVEIEISEIELTRLIDNNISNAIKYSNINSTINIKLENNILSFESKGKKIIDSTNIFKKYARENNTQGGNGLGLSIVRDITSKNNIFIDVISKENKNTFIYTFNCHDTDI